MNIPESWDPGAQQRWLAGDRHGAVQATLAVINSKPSPMPPGAGMQFVYYVSMMGDWASAAQMLETLCRDHPDDVQALLNLGVACSRSGQSARAIEVLRKVLAINPDHVVAWDSLAAACARSGRYDEAKRAGEAALQRKHAAAMRAPGIGKIRPAPQLTAEKRRIIAFSLWGKQPRYLRGALHNALRAAAVFPDWQCRFYVDASVPQPFLDSLREIGAELVIDTAPGWDTTRRRLTRRFFVANDSTVGHFLVRDCDSVVSEREARAVAEWLASGRSFHVMRDWWTHTDLMLAGMWGGIAGLLPNIERLTAMYDSNRVETPNWDQWFLRDCLWRRVADDCLIHDRCFQVLDARPFPGELPVGNRHVGQDEYAARRQAQADYLAAWMSRLPCLLEALPA